MTNKTPFEIRSEILALTVSHLNEQYANNLEFAKQVYNKSLESLSLPSVTSLDDIAEFQKSLYEKSLKFIPVPPSIEDILKKANELYSFVKNRD